MNNIYENQLNITKELIHSMPWENKYFYANFLAQTYYFVRHSTRLLAKSVSHFEVDRDSLYRRFVEHLKEENYHERMLVNDLSSLGFKVNDFTEGPVTKAFWESQHYKIDKSGGTSLLGYILFLEAIPVFGYNGILDRVKENFGKKASHFFQVHVDEDPSHLKDALLAIEGLTKAEQEQIWDNYHQTAELYRLILKKSHMDTKNIQVAA